MNSFWVLAFDIERSGPTEKYDTIAIGATVLNSDFRVLGELMETAYSKEETIFDKRCYDEFWSKHISILNQLENTTKLSHAEKQKNMITNFVNFVKAWETEARKQNILLYRVCDNSSFDVHFINILISKYIEGILPFPYELSTNKYGHVWETHSMMKGALLILDPKNGRYKNSGFSKMLSKKFPFLPPCVVQHDHLPNHDAHKIAHDFLCLLHMSNTFLHGQ